MCKSMSMISLPKINGGHEFEDFVRDILAVKHDNVQKAGVSGQKQNGIDIYYYNELNDLVLVQCKVKDKCDTSTTFRNNFWSQIENEYNKAVNNYNMGKEFYLFTTADRDIYIQNKVLNFNVGKRIRLNVLFWQDIEDLLYQTEFNKVLMKYYGNLISINRDNDFIAKRIELEIGVKNRPATWSHYALHIGYAKELYLKDGQKLYFTNCYFIMNLHARRSDTFPIKCYPSDLESVIEATLDRYLITRWLNSIDIMKVINGEETDYIFEDSEQWYNEYCRMLDDNY